MSGDSAFSEVGNPEYDALPDSVKLVTTFEQFQWMGGANRAALVRTMTEPEGSSVD